MASELRKLGKHFSGVDGGGGSRSRTTSKNGIGDDVCSQRVTACVRRLGRAARRLAPPEATVVASDLATFSSATRTAPPIASTRTCTTAWCRAYPRYSDGEGGRGGPSTARGTRLASPPAATPPPLLVERSSATRGGLGWSTSPLLPVQSRSWRSPSIRRGDRRSWSGSCCCGRPTEASRAISSHVRVESETSYRGGSCV